MAFCSFISANYRILLRKSRVLEISIDRNFFKRDNRPTKIQEYKGEIMAAQRTVSLKWYQDVADVIEHYQGQFYEIGFVVLHWMAGGIVRCVYYHHLIPTFGGGEKESVRTYQNDLETFGRKLEETLRKIKGLQKEFSEISKEGVEIDEVNGFIDLAIPITFIVPYLPTDPYAKEIQDVVMKYIDLLGTCHALELIVREEG